MPTPEPAVSPPGSSAGSSPGSPRVAPPPSRDGVGASCVAMQPGAWASIFEFLCDRFPRISRDEWRRRLEAGDVVDEQGRAVAADQPCQPPRRLYYFRSVANEPVLPFEETLLYRDAHLAVFDKPHGMPVMPAGRHLRETLLARVKRRLGIEAVTPVHRIDRDTAGLVLFSLQQRTRDGYHALFRERRVDKHYEAVAGFRPELAFPRLHCSRMQVSESSFMQMQEVPGEPNSRTRIDILEVAGSLARYDLQPVTGQRHQLRLHLAALGVPIVNDRIYPVLQPDPGGDAAALERECQAPLQLLAKRLAFIDPVTGEARVFESGRRLGLAADLIAAPHPQAH